MRGLILGTGGYHPNDGRQTSCVMLPELGIIFDAGTSFYRVADYLATRDLYVYLSHAHLDHIVGLTFFLVPMFTGKVDRVLVRSAPQYLEAIHKHLLAPLVFPIAPPGFAFEPLAEKVAVPGGGQLTHCPLTHPGGSIGYRIDWPGEARTAGGAPQSTRQARSLAYITDTAADASYIDFIRGVDVLIHECNFPDDSIHLARESGHCYLSAVVNVAREAEVKRLILTHFDPELPLDEPLDLTAAREIFPATELARERMEFEF